MPDKRTRRLAAIMFTDIAGYTKLMEKSEVRATQARERHREAFKHSHGQYHGKIIQYFGDGTLSVFDSCVEAVRCAIAIQQELQKAPIVPVRIGIHLGDIALLENDVLGNGVNIASRVESLSIPGAVLISDEVRKQIRNHEFETVSMGQFEMKNVTMPMEVFAVKASGLLIPKPEKIQGKAKRIEKVPSPPISARQWIRFASLGLIAMAIGAVLFWVLGSRNSENSALLDKAIREEKVAVAIFENFTNDPNLSTLGYLASEWITSSLREIGIKTVAPEVIRQYKEYIGVLPNNPENKISFAEITKAQFLISGSYFIRGDSLQLITRLLNTHTGAEIQQFPIFQKSKSEKESLVEEARQRLMSFWAIEKNQHFPKVRPPKYQAYEKFLTCEGGNRDCYEAVLTLDSTFILNHIHLMNLATWEDLDSLFNMSKTYVQRHWNECTDYEKNFYTYAKEFWEGNYEEAFSALELNYLADPKNIPMVHTTAYFAASHINRPDIAIEKYEGVFSEYEIFRDHVWPTMFYHYTDALNRLGQHEDVIRFAENLPEGDWFEKANTHRIQYAWFELYLAYLESGQTEKAIDYIHQILDKQNQVDLISRAAYAWSTVYQDSIPNPFHELIRDRLEEYNPINLASDFSIFLAIGGFPYGIREGQFYILGDWAEAERQFLALRGIEVKPENAKFANSWQGRFPIWVEAMLGTIYARQGKSRQSLEQLQKLEEVGAEFQKFHDPGTKGYISYWQARIHALLGNKEKAIHLLKRSLDEGRVTSYWFYTVDWDLAGLRGYKPFEELLRGKQ